MRMCHDDEKTEGANDLFTHLSEDGRARMVDVGEKTPTLRIARAEAWVDLGPEIADRLRACGSVDKGNVLETARIAGIMAAKKTPALIPMCHPLELDVVEVDADLVDNRVCVQSRVVCQGRTGVEMEAMCAVAVAALCVYDMVKSAGKGVQIGPVRLLEKLGGKSGRWKREDI